jgi:hypothetical protein
MENIEFDRRRKIIDYILEQIIDFTDKNINMKHEYSLQFTPIGRDLLLVKENNSKISVIEIAKQGSLRKFDSQATSSRLKASMPWSQNIVKVRPQDPSCMA